MKNIFKKQDSNTKKDRDIAGLSADNILKQIGNVGKGKSNLAAAGMSDQSKRALEMIKSITTSEASKYRDGSEMSDIAIKHSDGNDNAVEQMLKSYIAKNKGKVDRAYWFMLLDLYAMQGQKNEFELVAVKYAAKNDCSPPSWSNNPDSFVSSNVLQNIIILQQLTEHEREEMRNFIIMAKKQKYCRIDVSKLKLENSTIAGIQYFLNFMYELRKHKVTSLILQDNIITSFCQQYMKLPNKMQPKKLDPNFLGHEKLFWHLYLEVLQWKNRSDEFDDIALAYAEHYAESPPGWDNDGAMKVESTLNSHNMEEVKSRQFDQEINSANVKKITDFISSRKEEPIIVSFEEIDRMDFTSLTLLAEFLKEFKQKNTSKIIFRNPNQFLVTLFHMLDIQENVLIELRKY